LRERTQAPSSKEAPNPKSQELKGAEERGRYRW
jgi:hypothetical protein